MQIRTKLYGMVAAVGATLGVLLCLAWYTLHSEMRLDEVKDHVTRLRGDVADLRRHEKDFLARKNPDYAKAWDATFAGAEATLQHVVGEAAGLGLSEMASDFALLHDRLVAYRGSFHAVVTGLETAGLSETHGLLGALRDSVHKAEAIFLSAHDDRLAKDMLMLRRNEKDFLMRGDASYLDSFEKNFQVMSEDLSASALSPEAKAEAAKRMDAYHADFRVLAKSLSEVGLTPDSGHQRAMREAAHAVDHSLAQALSQTEAASAATLRRQLSLGAILSLAVGLATMAALARLARHLAARLAAVNGSLTQMTAGNFAVALPADSADEVGAIVRALGHWRESAIERKRMVEAEQRALSERAESSQRRAEAAQAFQEAFAQRIESIIANTQALFSASSSLTGNARRAEAGCAEVTGTSERLSVSMAELSDAGADLNQAVRSISERTTAAADKGSMVLGQVEHTNRRISGLSEAARRIGEIVTLINSIASQTNLLALNATIEAARAGEAGKGFAVVAHEVKHLANQTAGATDEIAQQVGEIQGLTGDAVLAISGITDAIRAMVVMVSEIAAEVEHQRDSAMLIEHNVNDALQRTEGVAGSLEGVLATARTTESMAVSLQEAAEALISGNEELKRDVDRLLAATAG